MEQYLSIGEDFVKLPSLKDARRSFEETDYLIPNFPDKLFSTRQYASFCGKCENIFSQRYDPSQEQLQLDHHLNLTDLKSSANDGCCLCAQFLSGFDEITPWHQGSEFHENESMPSKGQVILRSGFKGRYFWPPEYKRLHLAIPYTDGDLEIEDEFKNNEKPLLIKCSVDMFPSDCRALDYDSPRPRTSTMDALPLCKSWLTRCSTSHSRCAPSQQSKLPSRLIEITMQELKLSLCEEINPEAPYATLSHCWGSKDVFSLKKSNFDLFRKEIPSAALPKTFQQAIFIARYLGFQFLWIDSLCIVQDDPNDWIRESALMMEVYACSSLNIAATSAENGNEGCFFYRKPTWRCRTRIEEAGRELDYDFIALRSVIPHKIPLHRRAWVVQERYLARRTLHFYEEQIFWDCHTSSKCETFPRGYPRGFESAFNLDNHTLDIDAWHGIVFRYSRGQLTYTKDKLVAIGGLARAVQMNTKDSYLAGLWRKDLEYQLLWNVIDGVRRITPYTAPTWSWASLEGSISTSTIPENPEGSLHVEVVDAYVELATTDPFGEVKGGIIRITCDYICLGLLQNWSSPLREVCQLGDCSVNGQFNFDIDEEDSSHHLKGDHPDDENEDMDNDDDSSSAEDSDSDYSYDTGHDSGNYDEELKARRFEGILVFLLIFTIEQGANEDTAEGLLLQCSGKRRGEYYRVGDFCIRANGLKDILVNANSQLDKASFIEVSRHIQGKRPQILDII